MFMRMTRILGAVLLAALLTGCGSETAPGTDAGSGTGTAPAHGEPEPSGELPLPPDGTRWVGFGRVVVAVPEWWSTGETRCLAPVETTVYFDLGATADCPDPVPPAVTQEVSALAVLDGRRGYGEHLLADMTPVAEVAGRQVLEREDCERWFEGVCRRVFAVPTEGVVFAVTINDAADGDYEAIRDSLRILPDGQTTVPLATADGWTPSWGASPRTVDAVVRALEAAGLRPDVTTAERTRRSDVLIADLPEGSLLGIEPSLGSVIEDGGTVTVTVSGPRP